MCKRCESQEIHGNALSHESRYARPSRNGYRPGHPQRYMLTTIKSKTSVPCTITSRKAIITVLFFKHGGLLGKEASTAVQALPKRKIMQTGRSAEALGL